MRTWLDERAYVAFSNLVADNQYAAMGLFLLGTLARVRTLIRPLGRERDGDEEVEVGKEVVKEEGGGKEEERYDFGEVVRREDLRELSEDVDVDGRRNSEVKDTKKRKSLVTGEEDVEVQIPTKRVKKAGIERTRGEDDVEIGVDLKPSKKTKLEELVEDEEAGRSAPALRASKVKRKEPDRDSPSEAVPSKGVTKTKKKKKRKKGDAFDDLFNSLI